MDRRTFLGAASAAFLAEGLHTSTSLAAAAPSPLKPMALGLLINPFGEPEKVFRRVHDLGFSSCFLSLDGYINGFKPELATQFQALLTQYELTATTVEVVGPWPLEWNFLRRTSTIGLVPPQTRAARIDALRQASDFAKLMGIPQVQTHCGFIPEDPADPLYPGAVEAIRTVAQHCQANGQYFLMETGQETPTTMSRMIRRCGRQPRPVRAQRSCQGRTLARQPQQPRRGSAHWYRAGRLSEGFHQAASYWLYRRHHHRA